MPSADDRTGSTVSEVGSRLAGPLDLARRWAGPERLALILGGSHAAGEALWVTWQSRPVSLSDIDLYAVVPDDAAKRAASARVAADRHGLAARLLAMGFAAPLEVGFHTPADLAALPARPGTLALRRSGRVVDGDPAWREAIPAWTPRDVSAEEVWLLHENRAFELLWAGCPPTGAQDAELDALKRRHAVLKCALEIASVVALAEGEFPGSAAERVAWARPRWEATGAAEPPWEAALAWRGGHAERLSEAAADDERLRTVRAWVIAWHRLAGATWDPGRPFASVPRVARRARLRRRLREALLPDPGFEGLRVPAGRIRHALDGTPRHRLNAAAAARLMFEAARDAETGAAGGPARARTLELELQRVSRRLGVETTVSDAGADLVRAWDRGFLDGQRTEGWG